jgi:ABC-type multidrug transport system fused ATPase/permease subunit
MTSILSVLRQGFFMLDSSMRRQWRWLVILSCIAALLELVGTGLVFGLISVMADPAGLANVALIGKWLGTVTANNANDAIITLSVILAIYVAAKNSFLFFQVYRREQVALDSAKQVSSTLLRGYLAAPYSFHFGRNSAHLIRTLTRSTDDVYGGVLRAAVGFLAESLSTICVLGVLIVTEPTATLVCVIVLGGATATILGASKQVLRRRGSRIQEIHGMILQWAQQCLAAVKEIKILGREDQFARHYEELRAENALLQRLTVSLLEMPRLTLETMVVMALMLALIVMLRDHEPARVVPLVGMFGYVGFRIMPSVNRMIVQVSQIRHGWAAVTMVHQDFDQLCRDTATLRFERPAEDITFREAIQLEGLTIRYPGSERPALTDISLTIPRGASVGIVGLTGAGKSTLVDALLGLLSPESGEILVDRVNVAGHLRAWQRLIGYVPQTIYLTDDTLRRNIALGVPDDQIDEQAVLEAVLLAQLDEFVARLDEGLDSRVGERGVRMSGGQRQRVGIARALYHRPEILVFDEATAALDGETEDAVTRAVESLAGAKTVIVIAHRLSTLRNCEPLVFLKDGRIQAVGTMAELLKIDPDFQSLAAYSRIGAETTHVPVDAGRR